MCRYWGSLMMDILLHTLIHTQEGSGDYRLACLARVTLFSFASDDIARL